jgi:hypothetical protein
VSLAALASALKRSDQLLELARVRPDPHDDGYMRRMTEPI